MVGILQHLAGQQEKSELCLDTLWGRYWANYQVITQKEVHIMEMHLLQ